jgi:hypothetical protein
MDKMYVRLSDSGIIEVIMLHPFPGAIDLPYNDDVFNRPWDYAYNGTQRTKKNEFIWLPALHTFAGCSLLKHSTQQQSKECNIL